MLCSLLSSTSLTLPSTQARTFVPLSLPFCVLVLLDVPLSFSFHSQMQLDIRTRGQEHMAPEAYAKFKDLHSSGSLLPAAW